MKVSSSPLRVLVVDDNPADRLAVIRVLRRAFPGLLAVEVESPEDWRRALQVPQFDIVFIDYLLPWTHGVELLHTLQKRWPGVPVVMLTGTADESQALEAVRQGLEEYLPKTPESYALLPRTVRFALERARQRQALLESNETLRSVIQGVREHAIFMVDGEGHVITWNAGAQAMTGYREEEVLGEPLGALLVPEEQREALTQELGQAAALGVSTGEAWRLRKDGSRFWAESTVSALRREGGALRGFTVVLRDATERKRVEEERQQSFEFREMLLGVVSHDLRNPLQAILLQAQVMARKEQSESVKRAAQRISSGTERMQRMITDLLDFTRGRLGGGIPVERKPDDLFTLVRETLTEVELARPGSHITLTTRGQGKGEWDRDRLSQVVQNLVSNALSYGAPGAPVEVALEGGQDTVVLSVSNQGQPIPPELLPRLFDPFRRGRTHEDKGRLPRGLGLGLYIVQEVVQAHRGTIDVRSSEAEGTTFTVRLPRTQPS